MPTQFLNDEFHRPGYHAAMDHVLAQVNIGRLVAPLDSEELADFVAALAFTLRAPFPAPPFPARFINIYRATPDNAKD